MSLPPHKRAAPRAGVTLVELLVTVSLMALMGAAIVAVLSGGLRVWQRARTFGTQGQFALLAVDRLRRDLHNVRRSARIPFEGAYDRCAFAAAGQSAVDGSPLPEMGRLGYFLDEPRRRLCRSFVPYRLMRTRDLTDRCQPVLEDVTRARFSYRGSSTDTQPSDWSEHWDALLPPRAVKIALTVQPPREPAAVHTAVIVLALTAPPAEPSNEDRADEP